MLPAAVRRQQIADTPQRRTFLVHNNHRRQVPQNHSTVVQRGYYSADKSQPYAPILSPCDPQGGEGGKGVGGPDVFKDVLTEHFH